MKRDAFERARAAADRADPMVTRYRHGSVILDRKGRVIGVGRNHYRGDSIMIDGDVVAKTMHSEIHALTKVDVHRLRGATIINYGRTSANTICAKPCENCRAVLNKFKVRKIFYSLPSSLHNPKWAEEIL